MLTAKRADKRGAKRVREAKRSHSFGTFIAIRYNSGQADNSSD